MTGAGVAPARTTTAPSEARSRRARLERWRRARPWLGSLVACALIAFVNAAAWSLVTPYFQVPDERVHAGYVQYVAEAGRLPRSLGSQAFPSPDLAAALRAIPFSRTGKPSWSPAEDARLRRELSASPSRAAERGAAYAATNPPLYYAVAAIPYTIASAGTFPDRMFFMRLLSALMASVTVGFVYLFLREVLPGTRWAPTVGALAVAFQPLFAFVSGGINPDGLLWLTSAALFWLLARGFRRGLTPRLGAAIGVAALAGLLTKGAMLGLLPGIALGLGLMVWRARQTRRTALLGAATAVAVVVGLEALWLLMDQLLYARSTTTTASLFVGGKSYATLAAIRGQLSYLWQFFLPALPFMSDQLAGYPIWDVYFQGFVGRFGYFQFGFSQWVNVLALGVFGLLAISAVATLARSRPELRRRWPELSCYAALVVGLVLVIGVAGFRYVDQLGGTFEQARYLLPLLPLYAAFVALAVRGAGRRWAPAAAAFLVVLAIGHNLFALLLVTARYYA